MGDPHNLQLGGPGGVWPRDGLCLDQLVGDCVDLPGVVGSYYSLLPWRRWWWDGGGGGDHDGGGSSDEGIGGSGSRSVG